MRPGRGRAGRVTRLVVFAWGNPSRGDDALGPEFLAAVEVMTVPRDLELAFVTDFQLQPEHALDLVGCDLALFVDASTTAPAPFAFGVVNAAADSTFTSHALSPGAVLAAYERVVGERPPPAFALAIRGERFALGEPMSVAARENLEAAVAFYRRLLEAPAAQRWAELTISTHS